MDTEVQVQPGDEERATQAAPKPEWHAPVITRIDIKQTMSGNGYLDDIVGWPGTVE